MAVGESLHVAPNRVLVRCLAEAHIGSPLSMIVLGLIVSFIAYAIRDAYDRASLIKKRSIYPEYVIEMTEATSGSYLFHFAVMLSCFILAFFFLIPRHEPLQVTDIEFVQEQNPVKQPVVARTKAPTNAVDSGKPTPSTVPTPPRPAPGAASVSSQTPPPLPRPLQARPLISPPLPAVATAQRNSPPTPAPLTRAAQVGPPAPLPQLTARTQAPLPAVSPAQLGPPKPVLAPPSPQPVSLPANPAPLVAAPAPLTTASAPSPPRPLTLTRSGPPVAIPVPSLNSPTSAGAPVNAAPAPVAITSPAAFSVPTPLMPATGISGRTAQPSTVGLVPSRLGQSRPAGSSTLAVLPTASTPTQAQGHPGSPGQSGSGQPGTVRPNDRPNAPSSGRTQECEFGPYMAELQRRIKRSWFPPKDTESKRVQVIFKVHRDGSLSHLRLERSSGLAIADQAALKAIEDAAPFHPLPAGAPEDVDIQFTFDYNVFAGSGQGAFRQF